MATIPDCSHLISRSSNSSGYGTGSSRKSFTSNEAHQRMITIAGGGKATLINNNSSDENRWYEEDASGSVSGAGIALKEDQASSHEGIWQNFVID